MTINYNYFEKYLLRNDTNQYATKLDFFTVITIAGVAGGDNCQPLIKNCNDQRNVNNIANIGYKGKYCGCKYRAAEYNTYRIKSFARKYIQSIIDTQT